MQQTPPGYRSQKRSHRRPVADLDANRVSHPSSLAARQLTIQIESDRRIRATASGIEAVHAGAAVLDTHIRSQAKLKFGLYALASFFVVVAAALVVFSPDGREMISSIVAIALLAIAVGCAGFSAFAIKVPLLSAKAGRNPRMELGVGRL